ncbi:hypothetical protein WEU32_06870 [Brevundimonas sp. BH3]|uniref:hypothetical protein n=1 Tax=Brevundimonas sp. BH3 TaxID=3133089 RepID=UPI00324A0486
MDFQQLQVSEQMLLAQRANLQDQLAENEKQLNMNRAAMQGFKLAEKVMADKAEGKDKE